MGAREHRSVLYFANNFFLIGYLVKQSKDLTSYINTLFIIIIPRYRLPTCADNVGHALKRKLNLSILCLLINYKMSLKRVFKYKILVT